MMTAADAATSSTSALSPPPLFSSSQPLSPLPSLSPCSSVDLAVLSSLDSLRLHLSSFRSSVSSHLHQQQSLQQQQHSHTLHLIQQLREDQQHSLNTHQSELQAQWKRWKTQQQSLYPIRHPQTNSPSAPSPSPFTSAELTSLIQAEVRAAVTAATADALTTIAALRHRVHLLELSLTALPSPASGHMRQSSLSSPAAALAPRSLSPSSLAPYPPSTSSPLSLPRSSLKKSVRFNEDLHARLFLTIDSDDLSTSEDLPPPPDSDDEFAVPSPAYAPLSGGSGDAGGGVKGRVVVEEEEGKGELKGLGEVTSGLRVQVLHSPCASLDFAGITTSYEYARDGKDGEVDESAKVEKELGLTDLSALPAEEEGEGEVDAEEQKEKARDVGAESAVLSDSSSDDDDGGSPVAVRPLPSALSLPSLSLPSSSRAKSSLAIRTRPATTAAADTEALLSILHPVVKRGEREEVEEEQQREQREEEDSDDDVSLPVGGGGARAWQVNGGASDGGRGGVDESDDEDAVLVKG